ncbi:phage tail sheath family protein [Burkholderia sp. MS455]|uniref:phage tail sheath family protein n=1 Tax=Burkholderia sp. MS455 TaxID=2811788 RepID=UPI001AFB1369|nr:phage tail sheath C-terminal domain-containing protein [Burkholderia sp. MS455]QRR07658.1 phage tail sheath family protein [Burkholderia sp. MS455]
MSETYAVPGVYVTESNALALSIQSGETAVPVFVGLFNAIHPAKADAPLACVRIESWLDFTQQFGPSDRITVDGSTGKVNATSYVGSYSVRLYFENGGGPCYVLSLDRGDLENDNVLAHIAPAIEQYPDITLLCWCEFITPEIDKKIYDQLNPLLGASATSGGNRGMFLLADAGVSGAPDQPSTWTFQVPAVSERTQVATYFPAVHTGYSRDYSGHVARGVRLHPNEDQKATLKDAHVELSPDGFVTFDKILEKAAGLADLSKVVKFINGALNTYLLDSQKTEEPVILRASVAMAGVYARVDRDRGVWKAPANVGLMGVKELVAVGLNKNEEFVQPIRVDESLNAKLVDAKINAIRTFRDQGAMVWGARTMVDPHQTNWLYVPVRRLFNTVERDARAALRTVVFEPNSAVTWEAVRGALDHYLNALWRQGALQGDTPTQAYFVRVGLGTTMTQDDINNGKMIIRMGLAAVRPAEFIVLELTQDVATA